VKHLVGKMVEVKSSDGLKPAVEVVVSGSVSFRLVDSVLSCYI
jgi:hypothetical protein